MNRTEYLHKTETIESEIQRLSLLKNKLRNQRMSASPFQYKDKVNYEGGLYYVIDTDLVEGEFFYALCAPNLDGSLPQNPKHIVTQVTSPQLTKADETMSGAKRRQMTRKSRTLSPLV